MRKSFREALEAVLKDAMKTSVDQHGYLQHMDSCHLAVLILEYDHYCRQHGLPRLRISTDSSA